MQRGEGADRRRLKGCKTSLAGAGRPYDHVVAFWFFCGCLMSLSVVKNLWVFAVDIRCCLGFRPMTFISMAGECSGFPGSARTRFTSFPPPDMFMNSVFPFICNGKGYRPVRKTTPITVAGN